MKRLATFCLLAYASPAVAGGSLNFRDVEGLLQSRPHLAAFVAATLDIREGGMARRIGSHQPHLGGARIGPYYFDARLKGSADPYVLELVLCTSVEFQDERGQPADFGAASDFEEELLFVQVREKDRLVPTCPDLEPATGSR